MKNTEMFLALIRFALTGKETHIPKAEYNWDTVYRIANAHKLCAMLYYAIDKLGLSVPEATWNEISQEYYKALSREVIFQAEHERIEADFTKENISFIPLKGTLLKRYYPEEWMRTRNDIDILILKEDSDRVRIQMESMGYETVLYQENNHDVYNLEPVVSVEVHRSLFPDNGKSWSEFFKAAELKAREQQKDCTVQHFSKEDTYLYQLAHMAKHVINGGTGLRSLLDIWLFWTKESGNLDLQYIDRSLEHLGLETFQKQMLQLSSWWLEGRKPDSQTEMVGRMIMKSGVFGKKVNRQMGEVGRNIQQRGRENRFFREKIRQAYCVIFPEFHVLCRGYPILKRYPVLLPAIEAYRLWKFVCFPHRRKKVMDLMKKDKEEILEYLEYLQCIGLEDTAGI